MNTSPLAAMLSHTEWRETQGHTLGLCLPYWKFRDLFFMGFSIHTDDFKCYIKMLFTFMNELLEPCCWPLIVGDWSLSESPNGRNLKTSKIRNRIKTEEGGGSKQHWPFRPQTGLWSCCCCCCCFNGPLIQAPSIHPWKKKHYPKWLLLATVPQRAVSWLRYRFSARLGWPVSVKVKYSRSKSLETMNCLAFLRFNKKDRI